MNQTGPTASSHPDATARRGGHGRLALWAAAVAYAVLMVWQAATLPDVVPGHIGPGGEVTRWESRTAHVVIGSLVGLLVLAAFAAPPALLHRLPKSMLNLPHKEYWTRPEHWPTAQRMLAADLGWLGAATLLFLGAAMWAVGATVTDAAAPWWVLVVVAGSYLVGVIAYSIRMRFGPRWRPPTA